MNTLGRLLDHGDICPMFGAVLLMHVFGSRYVDVRTMARCRGVGVAGFLAYFLWAWIDHPPELGGEMLLLVVRALITAGLSYGLSLFAVPAVTAVVERVWTDPVRSLTSRWEDLRRGRQRDRERREAAVRQAEADARAAREEPYRRAEQERNRMEEAKRVETRARDKSRRERARSDCLLFYLSHKTEIAPRFSRKQLDEYMQKYLRDDQSPEEVERQAAELIKLIGSHLEKSGHRQRKFDMEDLSRWYTEEVQKAKARGHDPDVEDATVAVLATRYAELVDEYLEGLRPS